MDNFTSIFTPPNSPIKLSAWAGSFMEVDTLDVYRFDVPSVPPPLKRKREYNSHPNKRSRNFNGTAKKLEYDSD